MASFIGKFTDASGKKAVAAALSGKYPLEYMSYEHRAGQRVSLYSLKEKE